MIALGLLILFGLYIAVLVAAWRVPQSRWSRFIAIALVLSPVIWKTWDIPVGYYRFKQACEVEAGFKVYDPNPAPAKRIRLEGLGFGASYAEDALKRHTSLRQVEAEDQKYSYLTPIAYAVYERLSDGEISSILMDKVGKTNGIGETKVLEPAPSQAEYIISRTREYFPYRLNKEQYLLRHREGRLVATVTSFGYTDTTPENSLLSMPWGRVEGCGPSRDEEDTLIDLITPSK